MLKNSAYLIQLNALGTLIKATAYNGAIRLSNGRTIDENTLRTHYKIIKELPKENALYNIVWIVNGKERELIRVNGSFALCKHKIKQMKPTTKIGLLKPVKVI